MISSIIGRERIGFIQSFFHIHPVGFHFFRIFISGYSPKILKTYFWQNFCECAYGVGLSRYISFASNTLVLLTILLSSNSPIPIP